MRRVYQQECTLSTKVNGHRFGRSFYASASESSMTSPYLSIEVLWSVLALWGESRTVNGEPRSPQALTMSIWALL